MGCTPRYGGSPLVPAPADEATIPRDEVEHEPMTKPTAAPRGAVLTLPGARHRPGQRTVDRSSHVGVEVHAEL